MTDPGAPPLNPTLQKLEAVLRGIEERTPRECDGTCYAATLDEYAPMHSLVCDSLHVKRVRAEQARQWAASLEREITPHD